MVATYPIVVYNKKVYLLHCGGIMDNNFTDDDKKKVVEFMNIVAKKATFEMKTVEIIEYFKLLSFMQQSLLPKIDKHVFEVKKIVEPTIENSDNSDSSEGE